jgi:hypothetical protein
MPAFLSSFLLSFPSITTFHHSLLCHIFILSLSCSLTIYPLSLTLPFSLDTKFSNLPFELTNTSKMRNLFVAKTPKLWSWYRTYIWKKYNIEYLCVKHFYVLCLNIYIHTHTLTYTYMCVCMGVSVCVCETPWDTT